jgi:hypothetical protein
MPVNLEGEIRKFSTIEENTDAKATNRFNTTFAKLKLGIMAMPELTPRQTSCAQDGRVYN